MCIRDSISYAEALGKITPDQARELRAQYGIKESEMAAGTTSVSITGLRTELTFGARYRVRYGRDSKILENAELTGRALNGDLGFTDPVTGREIRVRPSTIDALFPNE